MKTRGTTLSQSMYFGLFSLLVAATGCKSDLEKMSQAASKQLGVEFELVAHKKDYCQGLQMESLIEEFRVARARAQIRESIQGYRRIRILPTRVVQTKEGQASYLRLWRYKDGEFRGETSKMIGDGIVRIGDVPQTTFRVTDSVLEVETQSSVFKSSSRIDYYTSDEALYDSVTSVSDVGFSAATEQEGALWQRKTLLTEIDCGTLVTLESILPTPLPPGDNAF